MIVDWVAIAALAWLGMTFLDGLMKAELWEIAYNATFSVLASGIVVVVSVVFL